MSVQECVRSVRERIRTAALAAGRDPAEITLVAATKVQTDDTIRAAIQAGITHCGENRVQEFTAHAAAGAYQGAQVHFIGHLQKNKVKYLVGKVSLIESVDSPALLQAIDARAQKLGLVQDILLEVNIAGEASKSGAAPNDLLPLALQAAALPGVRLRGLMSIPPIAAGPSGNQQYFRALYQLFVDMKQKMVDNGVSMEILSMGMSGDFEDAVAQGATEVRVGTALFGQRPAARAHG